MKLKELERRVYALLDENEELTTEMIVYGDPVMELRGLMEMLAEDAARVVLSSCPVSLLGDCKSCRVGVGVGPGGVGDGKAPDDYLRFVSFRMDGWERDVRVPVASDGESHSWRRMRATRRSRDPSAPGVAVSGEGAGRRLEVFGVSAPGYGTLRYAAVPKLSGGVMEIPRDAVGAVCSKLAEMVRLIVK